MLQLIGTKKDRNTRSVERYLKERRIAYQFLDIQAKGLAEKEWKSIFSSAGDPLSLVDTSSAFYRKNGYEHRVFDPVEEIVMHPELLRLPVQRNGGKCAFGLDEKFIEEAAR